jgi:hypothetical protein
MPVQSESQRKMIFAKRSQYKNKEKTPDKWKWIWNKDYENKGSLPEKLEESLFGKYIKKLYNESDNLKPIQMSQFRFEKYIDTDGKRNELPRYFMTYNNGYDEFDGELMIRYDKRGRGESSPYLDYIEWDFEPHEDERERVEDFIDDNLWEILGEIQ